MDAKRALLLSLALAAAATLLPRAGAQARDPFAESQREAAGSNPPGLTLALALRGGQARFRPGEVIGLELSFSSSLPGKYSLDSPGYFVGGRGRVDDFHLDPEDAAEDPLEDYFNSGLFGFMGGGLASISDLEAKPYRVELELNERLTPTRPGRYRLYVTSGRVVRGRPGPPAREELTVVSNLVEFEILPRDPAWEKRASAEAARIIDAKGTYDARLAACRVLRFLGTEDAVREMARRLGRGEEDDGCEQEFEFGLLSTPHRALAVAELERRLGSPDQPVTERFLRTLAFLSLLEQKGLPPLPDYEAGNEAAAESLRREYERRRAAYEASLRKYAERLAAASFVKEGRARAVSLDALISVRERGPREKASAGDAARQEEALMRGSLASVFADLPQDTQRRLLEFEWEEVSGPAMLPVLRRIYANASGRDEELRGLALLRLHELAPEEGRPLILAEMRRRPAPRLSSRTLTALSDETLTEVDALIAERFASAGADVHDDERLVTLAERYATAAPAAHLRAFYDGRVGRMSCAPQAALLAYFLRVEPSAAAALVEKALASRKDTGCYRSLLTDVAALFAGPELERAAVRSLDDADPAVASDAARMLGAHGPAATRDALLRRFRAWHEQWSGREAELDAQDERDLSASHSRVESALLQALALSPAWLADEELLRGLRALCVTRKCAGDADSLLKQFGPAVTAYFDRRDGSVASAVLAQYNNISWEGLKEKAAQFPKGTTFTWRSDSEGTEADRRAFRELAAHLERLGMRLTR